MTTQMNTGGLPRGQLLGRYRTYDDAQKVVDHLARAEGFDVKHLNIVGNELRSVESIRSRLSYPRVAGAGAAQGAMFGFFIGLLIYLFAPEAPIVNMVFSVMLGMAIWMFIGVISYAIRRGKRDFASSSQLVATSYDVVCDFSVAGRARQLMQGVGVRSLTAQNDPTGASPGLSGTASMRPPAAGPTGPGPQGPSVEPEKVQEEAPQTGTAADQADPGERGADAGPGEQARVGSGYSSLADGRPRYGVRLQDVQNDDARNNDAPSDDVPNDPAEPQSENQRSTAATEPPSSSEGEDSKPEAESLPARDQERSSQS